MAAKNARGAFLGLRDRRSAGTIGRQERGEGGCRWESFVEQREEDSCFRVGRGDGSKARRAIRAVENVSGERCDDAEQCEGSTMTSGPWDRVFHAVRVRGCDGDWHALALSNWRAVSVSAEERRGRDRRTCVRDHSQRLGDHGEQSETMG